MLKYYKYKHIDKKKWDMCIGDATNGLIYGYSWYLDFIAHTWDGIVYKDYEAVMPLIWNRKYGIYYIYQPAFVQQTGVFSINPVNELLIKDFIQNIPKKFKYIIINLNSTNKLSSVNIKIKKNYTLDLSKAYHEIYEGFNTNHKRNIIKAQESIKTVTNNITVDELMSFKKKTATTKIPIRAFEGMRKNISYCINYKQHKIIGIRNNNHQLISVIFFTYSHNRWYYILAAANNEGKTKRAPFYILNEFIKETSGNNDVLDFEGSEIQGVERFFKGFGAKLEYYYQYNENKLPFFLKWFKN